MEKELGIRTAEVVHIADKTPPPPRNTPDYFLWLIQNQASVVVLPPLPENVLTDPDAEVLFQRQEPRGSN